MRRETWVPGAARIFWDLRIRLWLSVFKPGVETTNYIPKNMWCTLLNFKSYPWKSHDKLREKRSKRKELTQQLQHRRSCCWCVCSCRRAELCVHPGVTLHSAQAVSGSLYNNAMTSHSRHYGVWLLLALLYHETPVTDEWCRRRRIEGLTC